MNLMEFEQIEFFVELHIVLQLFSYHLVEPVLVVGDGCHRLAGDRIDIKSPLACSLWLERWRLIYPIFVCDQVVSSKRQSFFVIFISYLSTLFLIWFIEEKLIIQNVEVDVLLNNIVHMVNIFWLQRLVVHLLHHLSHLHQIVLLCFRFSDLPLFLEEVFCHQDAGIM